MNYFISCSHLGAATIGPLISLHLPIDTIGVLLAPRVIWLFPDWCRKLLDLASAFRRFRQGN
jgi:hypothetical protein